MSNQIARPRRRGWPRLAALGLSLLTLNRYGDSIEAQSSCGPSINPIVCENQKTGDPDTAWDITNGAGDATLQGFATDISVNLGETVHFKVKTTAANFAIDIYRLGYYGGSGARKIASLTNITGSNQTACLTNATTGLVDCGNWTESASWAVPATAVSGVYLARLKRADTGGASHIVFIVRDDAGHSDLLVQTADTTWQAYNDYGGNSLYVGSPDGRAYKVSYNRPFNTRGNAYARAFLFGTDYPMLRWLEANGYNVSYTTGVDTDRRGAELLEHRALLVIGHNEYWSGAERANVEAARAAGVNLGFFTGNEMFWKTRWENSIDGAGTPYRTLVCYKETHAGAKIDPLPNVWTGTWRDPRFSPPADGGRPENAVTGTIFTVNCCAQQAVGVSGAVRKFRFWRNTLVAGLGPTDTASIAPGIVGYEFDEDLDNGSRPPGLIRLSAGTYNVGSHLLDYGSTYGPGVATHSLTLYRHSSGALVFSTGAMRWSWALDVTHDDDGATPNVPTTPDVTIQQATVNILADLGAQPSTLQPGLSPASLSTDLTPPTSTVTFPVNGQSVPIGTSLTVTGTATDAGGGVPAAVEVSLDGGTTWQQATGRDNWTFAWTATSSGTKTITSRAIDDSGNIEQPTTSVTVTVPAQIGCPCSIWSPSATPAQIATSDSASVELGVKFRTDVDGSITGIRFYKGATNTGTHTGSLWSITGTRLGTATFSNETGSGWQQVLFGTPVAVTANTVYVASYHTNVGNYGFNGAYFASAGVDTPPLHALANGVNGGNGVFLYGASAFPTQSSNATNYWVDVAFLPVADTTPPVVTSIVPGDGVTGVNKNTTVTATFNEAMNASTITTGTFALRDSANAIVPSTVSYNASTRVATLTPSAALAPASTHTATITTGVKDLAGNAMTSNLVWSFATAIPDFTPPTVVSVTPASGALSVGTTAVVTATFSEAMNASTITSGTFVLRDGANAVVPSTVNYNVNTLVATLTPSQTLNMLTTYTATITGGAGGVKDLADNPLSSSSTWSFTTGATIGLTTVGGHIDSGDSNYLNGSKVTTTTSGQITSMSVHVGDVDTATANQQYQLAIYTDNAGKPGTLVAASGTGSLVANAWNTIAVNATLQASTSYWLIFNTNGRTGAVNNMHYNDGTAGQGAYSNALVTFGTWPATFPTSTITNSVFSLFAMLVSDTTPPTVTSVTPANGATGVSAATAVTATFSEAINAATLTSTGNFVLRDPANVVVPGTVSYNAGTRVGTLTPSTALAGSTTFTATIMGGTNGVKDLAGNALASNVVWSFTVLADTTPPTVTSVTPVNGATGVSTATAVTATFSEAINAATLTSAGNFVLRDPANVVVPGTVSYNAGTGIGTLTPSTALAASTTYTATIMGGTNGIKDLAGNALASNVVWSFTTVLADTTPPTVTSVTPANGATGVSAATAVTATFSEAINAATLTSAGNFVLRDPANVVVPGTVSYNAGTRVGTLTPSTALAASTTFTATIMGGTNGVKDLAGNALASNVVWSFTVLADTTPPTVTSVTPVNGATGVSTATAVTATFSEAINAATLTSAGNFVLRDPANVVVPGTVSYNAGTGVGTLTPSTALAASTTYTATIMGGTNGVKDLAGNALANNVVWSFTTASATTTVGLTTIGSILDTGDSGYLNGSKVTTSTSGQIMSMSVYVGNIDAAPNQQYQVAIYADSAGAPGTLLAASATGTLVANSWNTIAINASLLASTNYWLMFNTNGRTGSVNNMYYNNGSAGQGAYSNASVTFGTWPATFPAATVTNSVFSLFARFQ